MHLINNHINGKTKCERLQIEHGRISPGRDAAPGAGGNLYSTWMGVNQ